MKQIYITILVIYTMVIGGCSQSSGLDFFNEIGAYSGVWRDTLHREGMTYIEDLVLSDNTFAHTLTDMDTHIVCDKESGNLIIGNENKMGWFGISPITNKYRQTNWDVLSLTPYQMRLYSSLLGERNYRKSYYTSFEEYSVQDTLREMLLYRDCLPLQRNKLTTVYGEHNILSNTEGISYLLDHPVFEKICFREHFENDTIFSYTLNVSLNDWSTCQQIVKSQFNEIRSVGGETVLCDADNLEDASLILTLNSQNRQVSLSSIKGYDYWPNVSRFLGMTIQDVKTELGQKCVYTYQAHQDTGLNEYQFQTRKDSTCSTIGVIADPTGAVHSCSVSLFKQYTGTKITKEAVKEEEKIALFLKKKYLFSGEDTDENGNRVYFFRSFNAMSGIKLEIALRLKYFQNGISNLHCVTIDYNKL